MSFLPSPAPVERIRRQTVEFSHFAPCSRKLLALLLEPATMDLGDSAPHAAFEESASTGAPVQAC
jgi:hypothetical protein